MLDLHPQDNIVITAPSGLSIEVGCEPDEHASRPRFYWELRRHENLLDEGCAYQFERVLMEGLMALFWQLLASRSRPTRHN